MKRLQNRQPITSTKAANKLFLRYAILCAFVFLVATLIILIPQVKSTVEETFIQSYKATANTYSSLLEQYIDVRELALKDITNNQYILNALLINNKAYSPFHDYLENTDLLGEDVEFTVLDINSNIFYQDVASTSDEDYHWAKPLTEEKIKNIVRLLPDATRPRFELAIPIYYGRGIEGIIIVNFSASPTDIFNKSQITGFSSALSYELNDAIVTTVSSSTSKYYKHAVLLAHHPIKLTYLTNKDMLDNEKTILLLEFIFSSVIGVMIAFTLLYFLGKKIILKPFKQLAESQQAISQAVSGISRVDVEGKYTSVNDAFLEITGYESEELIGAKWTSWVHKVDLPKIEAAYQHMIKQNKDNLETRFIKKDGSVAYVDVTIISQHDNDGQFTGHHCFLQDITTRKLAEVERVNLIDKLSNSNEELERFAYICSHDLQEPVRMVRCFSEKLETHITDKIKDDLTAQRYLKFLTDGAIRSQTLITDILDYSRLGKETNKPEKINLNEVLENILEIMDENIKSSDSTITYSDLPEISGHKTQIYQVFQNLINNAVKYQSPDAQPSIKISANDTGKHWTFSVQDNGIGIEDRHKKKVFDIFQRLHGKDEYSGTGVGLSICKKIIDRHGGEIWVESEKGNGSTFFFTLLKSNYQDELSEPDEPKYKAS